MKIQRYIAADMRQALKRVKEEQGPDAVILSSRQTADGLEVVAAVDYDESLINPAPQDASVKIGDIGSYRAPEPIAPASKAQITPRRQPARARKSFSYDVPLAPRPSAPKAASEDALMAGMRREINALRRMMESQLSSLAWNDFSRRSPVRANLLSNLIHLGLPSPLAQDIAARIPEGERDPKRAWQAALTDFAELVPVDQEDPIAQGGVLALVGPTGVGKTTAIARLAARSAKLHGPENVAIITTDCSRPGAQECLFSCGREWNIPVYVAADAEAVCTHLERLARVRVVLIDTAGNPGDDHQFRLGAEAMASSGRTLTRWLVLAANAQIQSLEETSMLYSRAPLSGIIATKLDEAASLGGLLSVVAQSGLPLTLTSDSADLSRPMQTAGSRALVKRAVELMRASRARRMDKESMAQHIGELHYALG